MDFDTGIGGPQDRFPSTRRSAILATRSHDLAEREEAYEILLAAYWKPVYKYIRVKWHESNEDAKDLTQAFFARAIEKGFFAGYDPAKASFRTYLRTCLDGFIANEKKSARRVKRGGQITLLPLDLETAEGELRQHDVPENMSMEDYFRQEWIRNLFGLAVERLREECDARGKSIHFQLFERYNLNDTGEDVTYEQLAADFGLSTSNVTNYLASARREFRRIVLETLRQITGDEQEFRNEARMLLGVDNP